jgi:effector-binding domain-containing protein
MKMLTLPRVVERPAAPYIAVRARVTLPFDKEIPDILQRLFSYLREAGLSEAGPIFFKYNLIAMPDIEMEFGVPVDRVVESHGELVSGVLPAGRYAEITYYGPYDDLITVNGVLIGWARQAGLIFDAREAADGERFENRSEIYHNSPDEEPDPQRWQTTVSIKLKD